MPVIRDDHDPNAHSAPIMQFKVLTDARYTRWRSWIKRLARQRRYRQNRLRAEKSRIHKTLK